MTNFVAYVYSTPCFNPFTKGIFCHMKHACTASRNLVLTKITTAELKIRLNC